MVVIAGAYIVIGIITAIFVFLGGWHLGDVDWGWLEWDQEGGSEGEDGDDIPLPPIKVAGAGALVLVAILLIFAAVKGKGGA